MKLTLQNTEETVTVNGVPARIWTGETESGVKVTALITRIAVHKDAGEQELARFEAELQECAPPTAEVQAWPMRMVL